MNQQEQLMFFACKDYQSNECLVARKQHENGWLYLIANGMYAGKTTRFFGPHCIADSLDCKSIVRNYAAQNSDFEILTVEVTIKTVDIAKGT